MDKIIENNVNDIVDTILKDYTHDRSIDKMKLFTQPDRFVIIKIIDNLMKIMYPGYFRAKASCPPAEQPYIPTRVLSI